MTEILSRKCSVQRIIAHVRALGSDATDLRDAAHEYAHASRLKLLSYDRESIHAALSGKSRLIRLQHEAVARVVERRICESYGEPYGNPDGWLALSVFEAIRDGAGTTLAEFRSLVRAAESRPIVNRLLRDLACLGYTELPEFTAT